MIYTGDGKGKTTAAIGVIMRMLCIGKRVAMVQFLKGSMMSAECALPKKYKKFILARAGSGFFTHEHERDEQTRLAEEGLAAARRMMKDADLLVLDEVNTAVKLKLLRFRDLLSLLKTRGKTHVICTGRNAPRRLMDAGDIVTEMKCIRHHFSKGGKAVRGIDY